MYTKRSSIEVTRTTKWEDLPEFLTVDQTAAFTGVCSWTIRQRIIAGDIPARRLGKLYQIPRVFFHPDTPKTDTPKAAKPQLVITEGLQIVDAGGAPKVEVTKRKMSPAKRRELVRHVAKSILREAFDRVYEQEREAKREAEATCPQ